MLGGDAPVRIQSMTNTDTGDVAATVNQCKSILRAGAELVRVTVRSLAEADRLPEIKKQLTSDGYQQPLIADVHFNPEIACKAALYADKVRINPGNFGGADYRSRFIDFLDICRKNNTAIRIGVNHGSLSERMMNAYGDSPEGMVESAMEYLRICMDENFKPVVVSLKSSNTRIMIHANRILVSEMKKAGMDYPIHLGITEAGAGEDARMKSAVGIGTLLTEGIGDTIRVSLTEKPENEIPFARKLTGITAENNHPADANLSLYPFTYSRRKTYQVGSTGGNNPSVVVVSMNPDMSRTPGQFNTDPDFIFDTRSAILSSKKDKSQTETSGQIPVIKIQDFIPGKLPVKNTYCVETSLKEINKINISALSKYGNAKIAIFISQNDHSLGIRKVFDKFLLSELFFPVILRYSCNEKDREDYLIRAATNLGGLFIDGLPDGLWLENKYFSADVNAAMAFNLLQASRARMSKTEFIACPSCGRTLFNIEQVLAKVKKATEHLKHLKIAIMGCIVNGPGEMADADYGYVGSGKGKITLYKSKDAVKKNIPEEKAIEELIHLIKENNDWIEPE